MDKKKQTCTEKSNGLRQAALDLQNIYRKMPNCNPCTKVEGITCQNCYVVLLNDLPNEPLEWKLPDEQFDGLLILLYLHKRACARAIPVRLLRCQFRLRSFFSPWLQAAF
jgi:hypothetical protein